jgi:xanthine dehydrogenase accessory factor
MENIYAQLNKELKSGNRMIMMTKLIDKDGKTSAQIKKTLLWEIQSDQKDGTKGKTENDFEGILEDESGGRLKELKLKAQGVLNSGMPELFADQGGGLILMEPFYPAGRLIILGGGHIAKPLVKFGSEIGFAVTVIDDRLSFANRDRFPEASAVLCESFETCFEKLDVTSADYVVIVTRGHRHDTVCLRQVLDKTPEYLGMIGSRRRVKIIKEQLIDEGFEKERIEQVCAPIGLEIGAITPEEIAIAIIAQIISKKRLQQTTLVDKKKKQLNRSDMDYDVLENLARDDEEPRAIITVISAKGSVPRGPGAKMILWDDGQTMGSIGGGCSEADVLTVARDLIHTGGYKIQKVDMTGEVAEDEGMVCGGIMDVLIETYPNSI